MSGMTKFLGTKKTQERTVDNFEQIIKGKSKKEVRELERKLLKPEPIPEYVEEPSTFHIKKENAFRVVFKTAEDVELVKKYFYIN